MQKVEGVATVTVSLNDGLTILDLKPDNGITLARLRQIVKDNGFVSKEAHVVARGVPRAQNNRQFVVTGTNEQLELSTAPTRRGDEWHLAVPASMKR